MSLSTNPNVKIEIAKQLSETKRTAAQDVISRIKDDVKSLKTKFSSGDIDAVTYKNMLQKNAELVIMVIEDCLDKLIVVSKRADGIHVQAISKIEN